MTSPYCFECTKEIDDDGDCFECGTGKYARDCKCGAGDWKCPWHQNLHQDCKGYWPPKAAA
jgi:hypothetical protein